MFIRLIVFTFLYLLTANVAFPSQWNSKNYGKLYAYFGYSYQLISTGNIEHKQQNHNISIGVGYNIYYKYHRLFDTFAGINIEGRFPFHPMLGNVNQTSIGNFVSIDVVLGAHFHINKAISLQPYVLFGVNVNHARYYKTIQEINIINTTKFNQVLYDKDVQTYNENYSSYQNNLKTYNKEYQTYQNQLTTYQATLATYNKELEEYETKKHYYDYYEDILQAWQTKYNETSKKYLNNEITMEEYNIWLNTPENKRPEPIEDPGEWTKTAPTAPTFDKTEPQQPVQPNKNDNKYQTQVKTTQTTSKKSDKKAEETKVGIDIGLGLDLILYNRFLIGVEYKYLNTPTGICAKIHSFNTKFGIMFNLP